ncbi:MAG: PP2C family protein-serine/threonine phosphatase [Ignavibacteria bacterium]|nr:PP2C family protein-serine/threonine phosphatase [Ignavibacteria bacterium]
MKIDFLESFDHYLTLPRERAYDEYMDEKNLKVLRVMLVISGCISLISIIVNLAMHQSFNTALVISLLNLAILIIARVFYDRFFDISNIRKWVIIFMIFQSVMFVLVDIAFPPDEQSPDETAEMKKNTEQKKEKGEFSINIDTGEKDSYEDLIIFISIALLIFKFPRHQIIPMFAGGLTMPLMATLVVSGGLAWGDAVPSAVTGLVLFGIALSVEKSRRNKFFEHYDFQHRKNFESMRMKRELNYAREIQLSMLPKGEAVINGIRIAGISQPASEVGGDYFDYFGISDHETGVFICDVSGHGVASGLMLSALRSSMHLILDDTVNPKKVIEKLNRMIRKTQSRKMFVTAVLAVIDTRDNKCRLYNAGHLPPYRISGETGEIFRIKKHGIALGAMGTVDTSDTENLVAFDFNKGDKIIFYTDGVNEAMNISKAEYGLDNFELFLNSNSTKSAKELLDGIVTDVKKFMGESVQRDDITLLVVERL